VSLFIHSLVYICTHINIVVSCYSTYVFTKTTLWNPGNFVVQLFSTPPAKNFSLVVSYYLRCTCTARGRVIALSVSTYVSLWVLSLLVDTKMSGLTELSMLGAFFLVTHK